MKKLVSRPFWLIIKGDAGPMDVLRTTLASGEEALPVFSFEEEARMFLDLGAPDGGWRVRKTAAGELVSVLFGPCAGVGWVVLDPLPGPDGAALNGLLSVERGTFAQFAANQGYAGIWSSTGSGNRVGGRLPDRDRMGIRRGRARRPGRRMTDVRQVGAIHRQNR